MIHHPLSISAAFLLGLFGGAHCIAMCGGLANAFGLVTPQEKLYGKLFAYNGGRIASYTLAGLILGLLSQGLAWNPAWLILLRSVAGVLLIAMGLYLAGWWAGLSYLESWGGVVWRRIKGWGGSLLPVHDVRQAWFLGMLWGWLPCGLVYTVLTWSLTAGNSVYSAMIMLSFGLGTLPVMLATGRFAHWLRPIITRRGPRAVTGLVIILFGLWTIISAWWMAEFHSKH